jgi:hypothetical protein
VTDGELIAARVTAVIRAARNQGCTSAQVRKSALLEIQLYKSSALQEALAVLERDHGIHLQPSERPSA